MDSRPLIVRDERFREHRAEGLHPERPERLDAIDRGLAALAPRLRDQEPRPATDEELLRVHTRRHLERLRALDGSGGQLDADTFASAYSVTIQKVVGISFASEDITITTVDNGDDAITRARELRPDVILADVVMPGKSGYEVCEAVKADPNLRHIPVLLLTGTFEAFDNKRAANAGASGHVAKPFEAQTLVERVKELLAQAPPAPPVAAPACC